MLTTNWHVHRHSLCSLQVEKVHILALAPNDTRIRDKSLVVIAITTWDGLSTSSASLWLLRNLI